MRLTPLRIDEAALRVALAEDHEAELFTTFDPANTTDFDRTLASLMLPLDEVLPRLNPALTQQHPDFPGGPTESVSVSMISDIDGWVIGYEFAYSLWGGKQRLSLATSFSDWADLCPAAAGIDGCVEIVMSVVALVNRTIQDFNKFVAPR